LIVQLLRDRTIVYEKIQILGTKFILRFLAGGYCYCFRLLLLSRAGQKLLNLYNPVGIGMKTGEFSTGTTACNMVLGLNLFVLHIREFTR
jgi:hypothetical protein